MSQMTRRTSQGLTVDFDHDSLIRWLFRIVGILAVCHLLNAFLGKPSWQLERLFEMSLKSNIPLWYSAMLWAFVTVIAFRCLQLTETQKEKWLWFSFVFVFGVFSIDEVALIHRHLFRAISKALLSGHTRHAIRSHFSHSDWPVLAAPFFGILIAWFIFAVKNLFRNSPKAGNTFVMGLIIFSIGGWAMEFTMNFLSHGTFEWVWDIHSVIKKSLEMIGTVIAAKGLLMQTYVLEVNGNEK